MSFVRLSQKFSQRRIVSIDSAFVLEYMPIAPENFVKVYLAGLVFSAAHDNDLEGLALHLNLDQKTVLDAFRFWQGQELVTFSDDPLCVEYLPIVPLSKRIPKFDKEKYKAFNDHLHLLLKDRPISTNEYNEYYTVMELYGIDINAMLMIVDYCIKLKGDKVNHKYITTVATRLANDGYRSYERVNEYMEDADLLDPDLKEIFKALKYSGKVDHSDRALFVKWTKQFGFNVLTIVAVAKKIKSKGISSVSYLDTLLTRYYENKIFNIKDIEAFDLKRDNQFILAKEIVKTLGLRYESFDNIIDTYIAPWQELGFNAETLKFVADFIFKNAFYFNRSLKNMDSQLRQYHSKDLTTVDAIAKIINESQQSNNYANTNKSQKNENIGAVVREGDKNVVSRTLTAEELDSMYSKLSEDEL